MKIKLSLCLALFFIFSVFSIRSITVSADEYQYSWGYMWWLSNNVNTYKNDNDNSSHRWDDTYPQYPNSRYNEACEVIPWDGWEAYDIKWSAVISASEYNLLSGDRPPQRPWLEYAYNPAPSGAHYVPNDGATENGDVIYQQGPWLSPDGILNKYRKVAVVYYRKLNPTLGVNLKATYLPQGDSYVGDSTVDIGVNVKNYSNPSAGYNGVHVKIMFNGQVKEANIDISTPGAAPNGTDYIFDFDAPPGIGSYPVTINVNYDHNPVENLPTPATAYNDNIVNGTVTMLEMPDPPLVQGSIELQPNVQLTGLDSSKRIKSGYGFGLKLNGSSNLGDVRGENYYYEPTANGYIKVKYAKINNITNFGFSSDPNLTFIIGEENNGIKTKSIMLLSFGSNNESRGILNWNFVNPVDNLYEGDRVFTFNLDNNTYGAYGNKPVIYLHPKTSDATYNLSVGGGNAQVAYYMERMVKWWHSTENGGHWHRRYTHWWDMSNNTQATAITINTVDPSPNIVVNGSMFDDDANVIVN